MFYAVDRMSRLLLGKAKKSMYEKDKVFHKFYLDLEDKNVLYESKDPNKSVTFYTLFFEKKKDIDRSSALYSIKASIEITHADIAEI